LIAHGFFSAAFVQRFQSVCVLIQIAHRFFPRRFYSEFKSIADRIAKRLQNDCEVIIQRMRIELRGDNEVIAKRLQSVCAHIAHRCHSVLQRFIAIADSLCSECAAIEQRSQTIPQ
jgi:hypothetical protein